MTQLCQIPGCHQRGKHWPSCDDDTCTGCLPRLATEGLACDWHVDRAERQLTELIRLAPDARLVAQGLVRRGTGGGSGKPASRPPLNVDAVDALDAIQNALGTICRDIAETRGLQIDSAGLGDLSPPDPITRAAKWLSGQLDWLRHAVGDQGEPVAVDVFREISECAARMRSLVEGPREQKYLGPCGAVIERCICPRDPDDEVDPGDPLSTCPVHGWRDADTPTCDGDVYGIPGAEKGRCKTCGATVDQADRLKWIDDLRREWLYTATEIADAYEGIKANTISQWASRGLLIAHGKHGNSPLYLVGEVLDLAAGDAARREEARAARARRREAAEMGA